ncbi:MAG: S9 family peptidase [Pseudomonadales bacterium]|nr:S9 family peptidase [Pseudomonadales bacterium]
MRRWSTSQILNGIFMLLLAWVNLIELHAAQVPPVPVESFAALSAYDSLKISPTGEYLAAVSRDENGQGRLVTIDLASAKVIAVTTMPNRDFISSFFWANDERVVGWVARNYGTHDQPFLTGQLVGMNWDGTKKDWIYSGHSSSSIVRGVPTTRSSGVSVKLLDELNKDDKHILLSTNKYSISKTSYTEVIKLNIYTGSVSKVATAPMRGAELLADNLGVVRFSVAQDAAKDNAIILHRRSGKKWHLIGEYPDEGGQLFPVAFAADNKHVYMLDNRETDTHCLYLYDIDTFSRKKIFHDPFVDVSDLFFTPAPDNQLIVIMTEPNYPQYTVVDAEHETSRWLEKIHQQFQGSRVNVTSMTRDRSAAIISVGSDIMPLNYFIYDVTKDELSPLIKALPGIDPKRMRPMEIYQLAVRDGTTIVVHLTRPEGKGPHPLIVHLHGGPHGPRDYWQYNPEVQMLASRGYAVLQVNFRGSGGYGRSFERAGYGEWGGIMQDDVTDATKWAITEGFTRQGKVCISGASYGGYTSMMGAVREPDLYQCVVAYAGIYDLSLMFEKGDIPPRESGLVFLRKAIGDDQAVLRDKSPVFNLDKINAPVLIVHGKEDRRVVIEHAYRLRDGLKALNKPFEWLVKPKEGHGFYKPENKKEYFEKILEFFNRYIGK